MPKKTAVLLDLGFVLIKLGALLGRSPNADDVHSFALKCVEADEELFRIYCYHCAPYDQTQVHPITKASIDFSKTKQFSYSEKLISQLKVRDNVAYRAGQLSFQGWALGRTAVKDIIKTGRSPVAGDFVPDLKQKGVDMKIGLDVAWLASRAIVERIILVTADSDFISPMRFARKEGVQIILVTMGHIAVKNDMREHADILRTVVYP